MLDRVDSRLEALERGIAERDTLLKFLSHRQFPYLAQAEEDEEEEAENLIELELGKLSLETGCRHVGYNGRWNKKADTCYCWWTGGTLSVRGSRFPKIPKPLHENIACTRRSRC